MKLTDVLAPPAAVARASAPSLAERRLAGRWLILARVLWVGVALLVLVYIAASVPSELARLQQVCGGPACHAPRLVPAEVRELSRLGLTPAFFAASVLALKLFFALVSAAVGAVIFLRRSDNAMALLAALLLMAFAASAFPYSPGSPVAGGWPVLGILFPLVAILGSIPGVLLLYLFPDGRFVPAWTRWLVIPLLVLVGAAYLLPSSPLTAWLRTYGLVLTLGFIAVALYAQVYRYRHVSGPVARTQTKWVVYGVVVAGIGYLGVQTILPLLGSLPIALLWSGYAVTYGALLVIPATIGAAILRAGLWDVDLLINRTLVYGALTVSVVILYTLVVGALGWLLQSRANPAVSLLAAGVIAVLFQPLRERVQRGVNRMLYGQRDEPYAVLAQLGRRIEAALAPDAVLPAIVETVAKALKLSYAAIVLEEGGRLVTAAETGRPAGVPLKLPLTYQGEPVGLFVLYPRAEGEGWSHTDRRLLEDLGHQVGAAAHAMQLTADLRRSRERLVLAREEERRRLRRDLHDGLGSALAALNFRSGAIRGLLATDPQAADALVVEQRNGIRAAIADIRRLVYDLRPPALDELGLVAALRERAAQTSSASVAEPAESDGLRVTVEAPETMPPLPAAVEVAAYRIAQEALANVARHAHAHTCVVSLRAGETLEIEIADDGGGIQLERATGVGLLSMRERAEELGGTCTIEPVAPHGTRVLARLPLPKEQGE